MTIRDDLPSLFAYTRWADDRMMDAVRTLSAEQYVQEPVPGWTSVRSSVVHMAGSMGIWAGRLAGEPYGDRPTEERYPTFDDGVRLFREAHDAFDRLVAAVTPEQLAAVWETTDPGGNRRRFPLWAAYRHVANHHTYHRGQVAAKLKRLGIDPPATDLVFWALEQTRSRNLPE